MDEYGASQQWMQQQAQLQQQQYQQYQPQSHQNGADAVGRPTSAQEWLKPGESSQQAEPSNAAESYSMSHQYMLNDAVRASSSISPPAAQPYIQTFQPHFYVPPGQSNYHSSNNSSSWTYQAPNPQPHVALSTYSSLNGANTVPTRQYQEPQQDQNAPMMMIDPTLAHAQGPSGQQHLQTQSHYPNASSPQPQHLAPGSYTSYALQPSPYTSTSPYYQQLPVQQSQGTLAPQALHSPDPNLVPQQYTANSFYATVPTASTPTSATSASTSTTAALPLSTAASASSSNGATSQIKRELFLTNLKNLVTPTSFTGAGAVHALASLLVKYGPSEVDAAVRLDILTKIRDNAGNPYFRAWAENADVMEITAKWLKSTISLTTENPLSETIMPLLHIIERLPLTIDVLVDTKIGKIVKMLCKEAPTPAVKDMASKVYQKLTEMVNNAEGKGSAEVDKSKKRKMSDPPPGKNVPPAKRAAVATDSKATKPTAVSAKKDTAKSATTASAAKTDTSFFSAPKPKAKLPSFKKQPVPAPTARPPAKKENEAVSQPSAVDPFQEALQLMNKARKGSPAVQATATPPPEAAAAKAAGPGLTKKGKPRKSVRWRAEHELVDIKLIQPADYGDDHNEGHGHHSLRDFDRAEGAALHQHIFEESIDWYEPMVLEFPIDIEFTERGTASQEKATQEAREATALGALYMSDSQIPPSPTEGPNLTSDEDPDKDVAIMTTGEEANPDLWKELSAPPQMGTAASQVSQLLQSLGGNNAVSQAAVPAISGGLDATAIMGFLNMPAEQISGFLQTYQLSQGGGVPQPPSQTSDWSMNNQQSNDQYQSNDYGGYEGRWEDGNGNGKGRGRGRGGARGRSHRKNILCNFHREGRCKFGDRCDFSHDLSLG